MDKVMPKSSDVFQANRDRAAALLKQLRADGIGHMIDGKIVASISGETFETNSPVDGTVLASVARGNAEDIDRAATAAALAFKAWRDMSRIARRRRAGGRHDLAEFRECPPLADPVRRHEIVRHRPRRRRLFVRLLYGNQARLAGARNPQDSAAGNTLILRSGRMAASRRMGRHGQHG